MEKLNEYEEYRRMWDELPKTCEVTDFPIHLDIELTSRCNLNCPICPYHSKDAPFPVEPEDMDFDLYTKIIDEGSKKGLKAIKLSFTGEPLLYPKLAEAIKYAKHKGILDVMINSNGTLLTPELSKALIKAGLDLFILTDYNEKNQLKNIATLKAIREIHGKKKPKIRVKTFRADDYWTNIADEITIPENYDYHHLVNDNRKSHFKCYQPWVRMLIMADGTVCRCSCGTLMVDKIIGSADYESIEDLWKSEYMNYLRFCHKNFVSELVQSCLSCPGRIEFINKELIRRINNE